jgi:hypothetical protein
MYIQYLGFDSSAGSRIYSFHVIDAIDEARKFTVRVQAAGFRPDGLKLQDGPDICFARLGHELRRETPESRAEAHLNIGELDIKDYLEQHHTHKPKRKNKEQRDVPAINEQRDLWRRR